jgi:hypothetical protein
MTDDLVKRLREDQPVTQDWASTMECGLMDEAADRIEQLENNAVLSKAAYDGLLSLLLSVQQDCIKEYNRAEKAEAERDKYAIDAEFFQSEVKLRNRIPATNDAMADMLRSAETAARLRAAIEYVLDGYGLEPPNFERKEWEAEDDVDWIVIHLRDALNFEKTDK